MPLAACKPCKERRLRCDRKLPRCSRCAQSRTECPGYGQTLSWPRSTDRKRSLLGPAPRRKAHVSSRSRNSVSSWVNVSGPDIAAHEFISRHEFMKEERSRHLTSPLSFKQSPTWSPIKLNSNLLELIQYFQLEAAMAIACDWGSVDLLGTVKRLAFYDDSISSHAVLFAALAVSSLLRDGPGLSTIKLQGAALRALEQSTIDGITGPKIAQHVAAGMLLCSFEIHGKFSNLGPWFLYVDGAKQLLKSSDLGKHTLSSEFMLATNWLYHHDVPAQFGLKHWRRNGNKAIAQGGLPTKRTSMRSNTKTMTDIVQDISKMTGTMAPSHIILWPLADVFQNIVSPSHPQYHSQEYRKELAALEFELESILNGRYVSGGSHVNLDMSNIGEHRDFAILEIYRLAALIYLERASQNFSGTSRKLDTWVRKGLETLAALGALKHGFPIFILACEARTDEQKIIILDCIRQTQDRNPTAGLEIVKDMVQSAWALEDLETEREVDYMAKLDVVVSGCEIMPSFA